MFNIGTDIWAYIVPVFVIILGLFVVYQILHIVNRINAANKIKNHYKKQLEIRAIFKYSLILCISIILVTFAFFVAFGPGNRVTYTKESGQMKALDEVPSEKMTPAELHEDMIQKKDPTGTLSQVANEDALKKMEEEDQKTIDEALKRARERNN